MQDQDKKNITSASFSNCLNELKQEMTEEEQERNDIPMEEIEEIIKQLDKDGDEMLNEKEFNDIMVKSKVFNLDTK